VSAPARGERCFVALALGAELGQALQGAVLPTLAAVAHRAAAPAGLHLTLAFLGSVPPATLAALCGALPPALAGLPAPRLRLAGTGAFPHPSRPRVFWVGVAERDAPGRLAALCSAVLGALAEAGAVPRERDEPFRPHVTVARARGLARGTPEGFRTLALALDWQPGAVELLASRPDAPGDYAALARVPLAVR
jgi:2'-5' RNA ligase